jgi:hypothetical protein
MLATTLTVPAAALAAAPADAATCHIHKHKNHYDCITPGAFCAKAAKGKYGVSRYAKTHKLAYICKTKSHRLHWLKR